MPQRLCTRSSPADTPPQCEGCGATGITLKHLKAEFEKPDGTKETVSRSYCLNCYDELEPDMRAAFKEYEVEHITAEE
jgi:hypothetical protein